MQTFAQSIFYKCKSSSITVYSSSSLLLIVTFSVTCLFLKLPTSSVFSIIMFYWYHYTHRHHQNNHSSFCAYCTNHHQSFPLLFLNAVSSPLPLFASLTEVKHFLLTIKTHTCKLKTFQPFLAVFYIFNISLKYNVKLFIYVEYCCYDSQIFIFSEILFTFTLYLQLSHPAG